jgi:hypothetical protein
VGVAYWSEYLQLDSVLFIWSRWGVKKNCRSSESTVWGKEYLLSETGNCDRIWGGGGERDVAGFAALGVRKEHPRTPHPDIPGAHLPISHSKGYNFLL